MNQSSPTPPAPIVIKTPQTCTPFSISLKQGSSSPEVKRMQQFLINQNIGPAARNLASHGVTTYFGSLTWAVVQEFQHLLEWLNSQSRSFRYRLLDCLDRGAYGWLEFVEHRDCTNREEVHSFYYHLRLDRRSWLWLNLTTEALMTRYVCYTTWFFIHTD